MDRFLDMIINEANDLARAHHVSKAGLDEGHNIHSLLGNLQSLKQLLSEEKAVLAKKIKKAENDNQILLELLNSKNTETEVLDQRLVHLENKQNQLRILLKQKTADIVAQEETKMVLEPGLQVVKEKATPKYEMLLLQLHQVQEELEACYLKQLEQVVDEKVTFINEEKSLQDLRFEIDVLRQSLSWRVTAPLRMIRAVMLGKKYISQYTNEGKTPQELRSEIDVLRQSLSWRVTTPLRKFRAVMLRRTYTNHYN